MSKMKFYLTVNHNNKLCQNFSGDVLVLFLFFTLFIDWDIILLYHTLYERTKFL